MKKDKEAAKESDKKQKDGSKMQPTEFHSEIESILNEIDTNTDAQKLIEQLEKKITNLQLKERLANEEKMEEQLNTVTKERNEYLDLLQRYKADFENYKKRTQKQQESNIRFSSEKVITKIFEPIEDLHRAISFAKEKSDETVPLEGIEIIYNKMMRSLEDEGVSLIHPEEGEQFNPRFHEAVAVDQSSKHEPGVIVKLFDKGFKIHNKVVRAAKVLISPMEAQKEKEGSEKEESDKKESNKKES